MATAKQGWLEKKGWKRRNWKKRWFVLDDTVLRYYKTNLQTSNDTHLKGAIFLEGRGAIHVHKEKPLLFVIPASLADDGGLRRPSSEGVMDEREYYFRAESEQEMLGWVNALNSASQAKAKDSADALQAANRCHDWRMKFLGSIGTKKEWLERYRPIDNKRGAISPQTSKVPEVVSDSISTNINLLLALVTPLLPQSYAGNVDRFRTPRGRGLLDRWLGLLSELELTLIDDLQHSEDTSIVMDPSRKELLRRLMQILEAYLFRRPSKADPFSDPTKNGSTEADLAEETAVLGSGEEVEPRPTEIVEGEIYSQCEMGCLQRAHQIMGALLVRQPRVGSSGSEQMKFLELKSEAFDNKYVNVN